MLLCAFEKKEDRVVYTVSFIALRFFLRYFLNAIFIIAVLYCLSNSAFLIFQLLL